MKNKENFEKVFGKVVRQRRQILNISQEKLAEKADLHRTYVSQIERGLKSPSLKALIALASALEIQPHILVLDMEKELDATN